jgi:hypothetical protein
MAPINRAPDQSIRKLLNFFGITLSRPDKDKNNTTGTTFLVPGQKRNNDKNSSKYKEGLYNGLLKPIDIPSDVLRAYEYFLQNQSLYNPNRERFELYKSLLFMVRNNGVMAQALNTYITETIEMKEGQKPIQIRAKDKKMEKLFNEWLDNIGFNYNIFNELVYDLVLLGDSFLIHDIDQTDGIREIALVDPFMVKDRIELDLNRIEEIRQWGNMNKNYTNRYRSIAQLMDLIYKKDKTALDTFLYYKSYLLGFELKYSVDTDTEGYHAIPPWQMTHFRLFTTKTEFFPFGRPLFINSLAPFQSFKTTEMLIDMLRVATFPKETVEIMGGDTLTPMDRIDRVNEVREFIENISPVTNNKDNLSINERLYSMEGLFKYDVIDTNVDMDKLGDLEKKLDDLVLSTGIPDVWLIPSKGNGGLGGENASAILYNNKIFQRRIESIKSAILEGFSQMFRLHLAIIEKSEGEKTEFELFMPINADMYSSDKIRQDSDQLRLATDFMNNLGQALGMDRGESLPVNIVKDIFNYYLPIDTDIINKWVGGIKKEVEANDEEEEKAKELNGGINPTDDKKDAIPAPLIVPTEGVPPTSSAGSAGNKKSFGPKKESIPIALKKFIESYNKKTDDSDILIREALFKAKKENGFTNGGLGRYIYWNDSYSNKTNKNKYSTSNLYKDDIIAKAGKKKIKD